MTDICTSEHATTDRIAEFLRHCVEQPADLSDLEGTGPVGEFERAFANWVGVEHAVAVSSGTAGLMTALWAAGIRPDDRVLVSSYGWPQTVAAVCAVGALPVFADIDPVSLNMSPDSAAEHVRDCRAILVTHTFGLPADMVALSEIADAANIPLIADAAQALGATIDGNSVARWADINVFSFGRHKLLSTGEGGMVVTDDRSLFERAVMTSQHCVRGFRQVDRVDQRRLLGDFGLSFRMHPVAALLGLEQLANLNERLQRRRRLCLELSRELSLLPCVTGPTYLGGLQHAFHHFVVGYDAKYGGISREDFITRLQQRGIPAVAGPVKEPFHVQLERFWENPPLPYFHTPETPRDRFCCPHAERQCYEREILLTDAIRGLDCGSIRLDEIVQAFREILA